MKTSRAITWPRIRVFLAALLLTLFALGGLLIYTSSLAGRQHGHARSDLRSLGVELIALSVIGAVVAVVLKRRLSRDE
jgi:hypothetical protein